jgi:hypothetical protein
VELSGRRRVRVSPEDATHSPPQPPPWHPQEQAQVGCESTWSLQRLDATHSPPQPPPWHPQEQAQVGCESTWSLQRLDALAAEVSFKDPN